MSRTEDTDLEPETTFDEADEPEPVDDHWSTWSEAGFTGKGAGHGIGA